MNKVSLRSWSTPLTVGAFFLMAATGVLMFFGWNVGLITVVHQWLSWTFLVGAFGHIVANIRPLTNHLSSRAGKIIVIAFSAILIASFFTWGLVTGPQLERPIVLALVNTPLSTLATMTNTSTGALIERFKDHGIVANSDQSINDLSRATGTGINRLLGIVFLKE